MDDHQELRRVLTRILTREGYEVLLAEDGRAALAVIEELLASPPAGERGSA